MPVKFLCTDCRSKLSVARERAGERIICPKCSQPLIVPAPRRTTTLGILVEDDDEGDESLIEIIDNEVSVEEESKRSTRIDNTASVDTKVMPRLPEVLEYRETETRVAPAPIASMEIEPAYSDFAFTEVEDDHSRRAPAAKRRMLLPLFCFYVVPGLLFIVAGIIMWRRNRLAGTVCLSGALFSAIFGIFHFVIASRREQRVNEELPPISWDCSICLRPITVEGDEAGGQTQCPNCRAQQRVP